MKERRFTPGLGTDERPPLPGVRMPLPSFSNARKVESPAVPPVADSVPPSEHTLPEAVLSSGGSSRTLVYIDPALVDQNPFAPRDVYTDQMIRDRADALAQQGQHDAIHVIANPMAAGRYIIADGWTRVQACIRHGALPRLLAEVHQNMSIEDAAWFGYEQNEEREQHCDFDRAMFYEKMMAEGATPAIICEKAKLSKTMMSFYKAFAKLPSEVLALVREKPVKFSSNVAYQLSRLTEVAGAKRTIAVATQFAEEDQPYRWLAGLVQRAIEPTKPRPTEKGKVVRYSNGVYKQKGDSFELSITVSPEKRADFAEKLEALLATAAIAAPQPESSPLAQETDASPSSGV